MDKKEIKDRQFNKLAVQHNNLIRASYKFGVLESRIFTVILSCIHKDDTELKEIHIPVSRLIGESTSNTSGRYYMLIQEACDTMLNMKYNAVPIEDRSRQYKKLNFFELIEYIKGEGYILARFTKSIEPYLINLSGNFTTTEVEQLMKLRSGYAHRIYWLLMSVRKKYTPQVFEVEELKYMLLGEDNKYAQYGDFKKKVLNVAFNEIRDLDDPNLDFDVEELKQGKGKSVTHLKFIFKNKLIEEQPTDTVKAISEESNTQKKDKVKSDPDVSSRLHAIITPDIVEHYNQKLEQAHTVKERAALHLEKYGIVNSDYYLDKLSAKEILAILKDSQMTYKERLTGFMLSEALDKVIKDNYFKNKNK